MHTSGPRRYSKLELCTTRQLESLALEFCYDVETLRNVAAELGGRTCRHSAHVKRAVDRQLKALTSGPPKKFRPTFINGRWLAIASAAAVLLSVAIDQLGHWLVVG